MGQMEKYSAITAFYKVETLHLSRLKLVEFSGVSLLCNSCRIISALGLLSNLFQQPSSVPHYTRPITQTYGSVN